VDRARVVRRVGLLISSLCLLIASVGVAQAHFGNPASITVTLDHIDPGATFPVVAADFPAGQTVNFQLARDTRSDQLGSAIAGPDGHFSATFAVPADFPAGWADLYAVSQDGTQSAISVMVGPRTASTPSAPSRLSLGQDPAVLLLVGTLGLGVLVIAYSVIRRARKPLPKPKRRRS
jgi:hypothetical protein